MKLSAKTVLILTLFTLPFLAACDGGEEPPAPKAGEKVSAADLSAAELGALGAEVYRSPDDAQRILTDRGIDPDEFETAVREVAADVEDSRDYAQAFGENREKAEGEEGEPGVQ